MSANLMSLMIAVLIVYQVSAIRLAAFDLAKSNAKAPPSFSVLLGATFITSICSAWLLGALDRVAPTFPILQLLRGFLLVAIIAFTAQSLYWILSAFISSLPYFHLFSSTFMCTLGIALAAQKIQLTAVPIINVLVTATFFTLLALISQGCTSLIMQKTPAKQQLSLFYGALLVAASIGFVIVAFYSTRS